jgi:HSP20 family protein
MNHRETIPALFVELQKLCDPHQFMSESAFPLLTRNEVTGLSLYEDDDHLYLEAAMPGVKPDEIQISIEKGLIWIKAEAADEEQKDKKVHFKTERNYSYRIPLPMGIDVHSPPEAVCKDGILKMTMEKSRTCKPIKINVKSS